jgi:hypothetical protein
MAGDTHSPGVLSVCSLITGTLTQTSGKAPGLYQHRPFQIDKRSLKNQQNSCKSISTNIRLGLHRPPGPRGPHHNPCPPPTAIRHLQVAQLARYLYDARQATIPLRSIFHSNETSYYGTSLRLFESDLLKISALPPALSHADN